MSIFKPSAIIAYVVKKIFEKNNDRQIGKALLQKMIYLISRYNIGDFSYSLYMYSPYSDNVDFEINFAEDSELIKVEWIDRVGYCITPLKNSEDFFNLISEDEKRVIDEMVDKYCDFTVEELSIITTAIYIQDYFKIDEKEKIVEVVSKLKSSFNRNFISDVLNRAIKNKEKK